MTKIGTISHSIENYKLLQYIGKEEHMRNDFLTKK